ncbi:MAG: M20 family metallopeptidase [Gammaproteobacteria bacterium]|jgi:amidohydrolase
MLDKAIAIKDFIISTRRDIHLHPELGYQEFNTAKLVACHLEDISIPYQTGFAKTGVIAELTKGAGPTVLVRADMDALPIDEQTGLEFQSQTPGVMHACGHDTHTAMLLGTIKLLQNESFAGTIRFLFQPAEEGNYDDPDGFSGAQRMIVEGALDDVDAAIGLHQMPTIPTGTIAITTGSVMAAADFFEISVAGKSAHAGLSPEAGIDAVMISAELILSLQTIVSRQVGPTKTAVISVSTIEGGSAANVIADRVRLTGTIRALDEEVHQTILKSIQARCDAFSAIYNTDIDFKIYYGVPVTVNDAAVSKIATRSAGKIFSDGNVAGEVSVMGGEDFAYIAQKVPSCYALLGTKVTEGEAYPLHSPKMVVNEEALPMGAAYLAQTALDLLENLK